MTALTLDIQGMSCAHCVAAVEKALNELDGVQVQQVAIGSAQVDFEEETVTPAQIVDAVEQAGYDVSVGE